MAEVSEKLVSGFLRGQLYLGKMEATKLKLQVTAFRDALGVLQCLRDILVEFLHLLRAFEVEEIAR